MERGSGIALWRQIEERLAQDIADGAFPIGGRLPTEPELAARFGVNRHTLRRAMMALAERGLVRIEQGRGTFVQDHVVDYVIGRRTRFSEILSRQQREPGGRLLHAASVAPEAPVAKSLRLDRETICTRLEILGEADGLPISVSTNFFSAARLPDMAQVVAETGSISRGLAHHGIVDYARRTTRITARPPDRRDAEHLKQSQRRPVLVAESVNVDGAGRPLQFAITRFAADRVQIIFES